MPLSSDLAVIGPVVQVLLIAGAVAVAVLGVMAGQRRRRRLAAWATSTGWQLRSTGPELVDRWRGAPFGEGRSRRATEVLTGTWQGRAATSFRYRYTTQSGDSTTTHTFHVIALSLPAYLPTLSLTPQGLGARLAKAVGGQDLEFESADFNAAWRVQCRDPRFASDVVHPRLMERLLRADARANVRIEGTDVLTWCLGQPDLDAIARRLGLLDAVVASIPRFVWLNHGYDPETPSSPEGEK